MGHSGASAVRGRARGRRWSGWPTTCAAGRSSSTSSANEPARLDAFAASIKDGRGHTLHRRLFVVEADLAGAMSVRQPTIFLDGLVPAPAGTSVPDDGALPDTGPGRAVPPGAGACSRSWPRSTGEREHQIETIRRHVEISLNTLIDRQNQQLADYLNRQVEGQTVPGLDGLISQAEAHLDRLNERLERRLRELEMERHCTIADITHLGRAWVLPHPERTTPGWPRWSATTRSSGSPWSSRSGTSRRGAGRSRASSRRTGAST